MTVWTSLPVETRKSLSESSNGENKSLFGNNTAGDYSFTGPRPFGSGFAGIGGFENVI
jgi:hypothetical protein